MPESATPLIKGHHQASDTMKPKELSKQVRDKVVEKYRSGLGYKKISETLNIPRSTIKSIMKKWKEYGTTNLTDQARRALIREATKITWKELQKLHSGDWSICP